MGFDQEQKQGRRLGPFSRTAKRQRRRLLFLRMPTTVHLCRSDCINSVPLRAALVEEGEDPVGQRPIISFIGRLIPLRAYRDYAHRENIFRRHRFNRMTIPGPGRLRPGPTMKQGEECHDRRSKAELSGSNRAQICRRTAPSIVSQCAVDKLRILKCLNSRCLFALRQDRALTRTPPCSDRGPKWGAERWLPRLERTPECRCRPQLNWNTVETIFGRDPYGSRYASLRPLANRIRDFPWRLSQDTECRSNQLFGQDWADEETGEGSAQPLLAWFPAPIGSEAVS